MQDEKKLICVAVITSAHGIKGSVKIRSFTEYPTDIANYSPLYGADGTSKYEIKILSENGGVIIAEINGVKSRNDAEMLGGTELFIYRDMLPEAEEDEFYYEDLIGLDVRATDNDRVIGNVTAIYNHGAGDIIEIKLSKSGKTELLAFTKENFPEVFLDEGYILINFPEVEFLDEEK